MRAYFHEEFKRAFLSKITIVTTIISILLFFGGFIEYMNKEWLNSNTLSVLYLFLLGYNSGTSNFMGVFFPIIACMPFAASYLSDKKSGIDKYIYLRISRKKYQWIKVLVNGLAGGFVVFIGAFTAVLFLLVLRIFLDIPLVGKELETVIFFQDMGISNPFTMIMIILLTLFLCGFTIATFSLGVSVFIHNIYLSTLSSFVYYLISALILSKLYIYINLLSIYDISYFNMGFIERMIYEIILCSIGVVCFFLGGRKLE